MPTKVPLVTAPTPPVSQPAKPIQPAVVSKPVEKAPTPQVSQPTKPVQPAVVSKPVEKSPVVVPPTPPVSQPAVSPAKPVQQVVKPTQPAATVVKTSPPAPRKPSPQQNGTLKAANGTPGQAQVGAAVAKLTQGSTTTVVTCKTHESNKIPSRGMFFNLFKSSAWNMAAASFCGFLICPA